MLRLRRGSFNVPIIKALGVDKVDGVLMYLEMCPEVDFLESDT